MWNLILDYLLMIFTFIGMILVGLLVLRVLLQVLHKVLDRRNLLKPREGTPPLHADPPLLKPVSIPTRGCSWYAKFLVWRVQHRQWELAEDWEYRLRDGTRLIIKKETKVDGASIPRLLWPLLSPTGLLLIPAVLHDCAYENNQLLRIDDRGIEEPYLPGAGKWAWDCLFREVTEDVNGIVSVAWLAWLAVAAIGHGAWHHCRKKDRATPP